jgi:hypothetical protein
MKHVLRFHTVMFKMFHHDTEKKKRSKKRVGETEKEIYKRQRE